MGRGDLSDEEWARLEPHLPTNRGRGGRWQSHRRVINGILFRQRTGLPWGTCLPASVAGRRFMIVIAGGRRTGTWERILRAVQADADAEGRIDWSMGSVDSSTCRAHQHAAGVFTRAPEIPDRRMSPARHRPDEALDAREACSRARSTLLGKVGVARSGLSSRPASGGTHRR
ncbi:transposase [Streptomyces sp. NPDC060235]|uniref:transposase n=1 Tax=Streptomyces sp. NPDC060235 TaxID=3347080 RepID=UPI003649B600